MGNHLLSQEEIDALLKKEPAPIDAAILSPEEIDALGEIGNISMGTAATTLSQIIGHRVRITTPTVSIIDKETFTQDYPLPHLTIEVQYNQGLEGMNIFIMGEQEAYIIAQLMLEEEPKEEFELDEIRLSAIGEAMNQMMGAAATAVSTMFNTVVTIMPPQVGLVDFAANDLEAILPASAGSNVVQVSFDLTIEGLLNSKIMQVIPTSFAKGMVETLMGPAARPKSTSLEKKVAATAGGSPEHVLQEQPVVVQPVHFAPLKPESTGEGPGNMELLLDIPLEVSVELGRTKRLLKEILALGVGSILELDNLAGEPVDILVNGTLIAHGEVVVIGENFGVRVTNIVGLRERMKTLQ